MTRPGLVSIIIPARNEQFLQNTVAGILHAATGDIEVIPVLDGYWPDPPLPTDPRLVVLHHGSPRGMRAAINHASAIAKGEFLMKSDAHCIYAPGFDQVLKDDIEKNWLVVLRRKRLDAETWGIMDVGKPDVDYHYLSCPITNPDGYSMHGANWDEKNKDVRLKSSEYDIDDTMSFQGSMWFMYKTWFDDFLHGMSEQGYGGFCQEPQEIGNKTWLGGGRVVVNKKTWYAHLHKGKKYGRGYHQDKRQITEGHNWSGYHWMHDQEPHMLHKFEWLVEKFWPVPTWPKDWHNRLEEKVK